MFKRCLGLILLSAVLLSLSSCGLIIVNEVDGPAHTESAGTTGPEATDGETEAPEDDNDTGKGKKLFDAAMAELEALSTPSLSGIYFVIAGTDQGFFSGDGTENLLNSDRVARNAALEKKFDANISFRTYTKEELYSGVSEAYKAGDYFADILAISAKDVGMLATDGLLENLRSIKGLDLKLDCFDEDSISALSVGHEIVGLYGDGCFDPSKMYAMYFNRTLAGDAADLMYKAVEEGKWTIDLYNTYAKDALISCEGDPIANVLLGSTGYKLMITETDKTPVPNTYGDGLISLCEKIKPTADAAGTYDDFTSGKSLFMTATLARYPELAKSGVSVGVLPCPSEEEGEYRTYSPDAAVLAIVRDHTGADASASFIKAFNIASKDYLRYGYLYDAVMTVALDEGSVKSLGVIITDLSWDFALLFSSGYRTLRQNTYGVFEAMLNDSYDREEHEAGMEAFAEYLDKWFGVEFD